ncbi:Beta-hexosaminidase [Firmicutes bacterium ASF500]|nr:Beta-hexosaminidase [Firmicutes bacterium ASF500]
MEKWIRARYQPNLPLNGDRRVTASPEHIALSRRAAQEGAVLLKNDGDLLPLAPDTRVALFGKGSFDYVKGGGGSGDVTVAYVKNLYDGLKGEGVSLYEPLCDYYRDYVAERYAAGEVPGLMAEAELPLVMVRSAREAVDVAVIVLSRFSGEGWDREPSFYLEEDYPWPDELNMPRKAKAIFPRGDYYLTEEERSMVERVCAAFDKVVVVLNVGGVVDVSWFCEDDRISSALLAYQGGIEGGAAVAALLMGKANPCGKLPDTFARDLSDYPSTEHFHDSPHYVDYTEDIYVGYRYFETLPGAAERVCYPFGYGLSYTSFSLETVSAGESEGQIKVSVRVTNTGKRTGKEVVQLYYAAPWGKLQKPARCLASFQKTRLLEPGECETVELSFAVADMASFDDLGKIAPAAWVLEAGRYSLYMGTSVRDAEVLDYAWEQAETEVLAQLSASLAPSHLPKRLLADGTYEDLPAAPAADTGADLFPRLTTAQAEGVAPATTGRGRYMLAQPYAPGIQPLSSVAEGKLSLDEFMAQLSDGDLIHLLGGQPNVGVSNTFGLGNLPEYGVPNLTTADGPAGLRIQPEVGVCTTAWPCATLLAATWDGELVSKVGAAAAAEVKENNISIWLAPAVNIHRSPLCGRNFEYYSEDPLLTGKLAGAMVRGIQSQHIAATVKHFACNNKESNRKYSDSRLSQRALQEIYLKAFEIIVREEQPWAIMSSYNVINGQRASESRELLTTILREEWGYAGLVMSDWWTRGEHYKELLAGNDLKMANGYPERVEEAIKLGAITRADLEICARRVLGLILKID